MLIVGNDTMTANQTLGSALALIALSAMEKARSRADQQLS